MPFFKTDSLRHIVIPSQVRYIGRAAFSHQSPDYDYFQVTIKAGTPPIYDCSFQFDTIYCTIPCGTTGVYEAAWSAPGQHFIFTEDCSGIDDVTVQKVRIYPNPTADVLYFEGDFDSGCDVRIYDMAGKLVETAKLTSNMSELSISHLSEGYYVVKIEDGNGKTNSIKVCKLR